MRIVTWNINGLRACLRRRFNGKLVNLLTFLDADIICLQETKIATARVEPDLAFADGWESFFANCRVRGGYSGVATFCRAASCVPVAALDGFTGLLSQSQAKPKDLPPSTPAQEALSNPSSELFERFSQGELESLDSEGRVIITDHGAFVLVNVYGPAISTEDSAEERYAFKLQFYRALLMRIAALREAGRAVILLGDLNISLATIDSCDPGNAEDFASRADRRMLTQLLTHNGGPFLDTFRKFHPDRREAYTCWSTASGARINNYGTRIDLILAAGPCGDASRGFHAAVTGSDIWMDAHGSDHAPVYADLASGLPVACPEVPPQLSSRYLYTGKQGNLKAWLASASLTQPPASQAPSLETCAHHSIALSSENSSEGSAAPREALSAGTSVLGKRASAKSGSAWQKAAKRKGAAGQSSLKAFMKPQAAFGAGSTQAQASPAPVQASETLVNLLEPCQRSQQPQGLSQMRSQAENQAASGLGEALVASTAAPAAEPIKHELGADAPTVAKQPLSDRGQHMTSTEQSTVRSQGVFSREHAAWKQRSRIASGEQGAAGAAAEAAHPQNAARAAPNELDELVASATQWEDIKVKEGLQPAAPWPSQADQAMPEQNASAKAAWAQIQQRMKPPLCKGHSEPCVIRQVKKGGPNQGRVFFVCRRAAGNLPEGRCDFFQWEGDRQLRGSRAQGAAKSVTLKGCWN